MYTIYALIIIVFVITFLVYMALGRLGAFGFAEDKSKEARDIFKGQHDSWDN